MDRVIATNGKTITVAGHQPNAEFRTSGFQSASNCRSATVDGVHAERFHVIRKPGGTSDTGDEYDVLAGDTQLRNDGLGLLEDRVISATGTPADFLVRYEFLGSEFFRRSSGGFHVVLL